MRCDQCKFWTGDVDDWELSGAGFRKCEAVRQRWTITDEASRKIEWDGKEDGPYLTSRREALKRARAYVQDGSDYRADLCTGPDFFCALFDALDP